jgi:estrone sulfotransferase
MLKTIKGLFKGSPYKGLQAKDVVLASFPKTGNTFTRFVLANLLSIQYKDGEQVNFYNLGQILPEFEKDDISKRWTYPGFPRIIKTHEAHRPEFDAAKDVLYVMRDPRDTMISYYKYLQARKKVQYTGGVDKFIRDPQFGLQSYLRHIESWEKKARWIFRYEDLMSNPYPLFERFLKDRGVVFVKHQLETAIFKSQPDRMRKVENEQGRPGREKNFKEGFVFVRNASTGQWKEFYSEDQLKYFYEQIGDRLKHLGYDFDETT